MSDTPPTNEDSSKSTQQRIDEALTQILGIHGGWVLAVETVNPTTGEPNLHTTWDSSSTKWTQLGMANVLMMNLEEPFAEMEDSD